MSFMSKFGQLELKAEQEGLKLIHAAGDWVDHLTWDQVRHLLLPEIREHAPDLLAPVAPGAGAVDQAEHAAATAVADGAGTGESFEDWARRQIGQLAAHLAEHGAQLAEHAETLDSVTKDLAPGVGEVQAPAKKTAAGRAAARKAPARTDT